MAGARGMLKSGATIKAQTQFGQGIAAQEYGNFLNRLAGISGQGQQATGGTAAAGGQFGQMAGQNALAAGQARASGYAGVNNALQGTVGNLTYLAGRYA